VSQKGAASGDLLVRDSRSDFNMLDEDDEGELAGLR
jgi:hypothetical protein